VSAREVDYRATLIDLLEQIALAPTFRDAQAACGIAMNHLRGIDEADC
jgi:hypothetical protein